MLRPVSHMNRSPSLVSVEACYLYFLGRNRNQTFFLWPIDIWGVFFTWMKKSSTQCIRSWLSSSTARPTTDTFTTYSIRHRTVSSGENTAISSDANTEELKRKTRTGYPPLPPDPPQTHSPHTPSDTAPSLPGRTPPCPPTQTLRNWGEKQELVILLYRQTHHRHIHHILHQTPHRLFRGEHRHVLRRKHRGTEEKNKNWLSSSTARPTTDTFTTYSIRHRTVSSGENTAMSSDANTEELRRKTRTGYPPLPPDPPQTHSPHTPSDTAPSLPGRTPPCPQTQTLRNWGEKQELVILLYRQTHHRHIHHILHQTPHRLFPGEHRHVLRRKHWGTEGEKQELVILLYRQTHHRHIHHILHQTPHRLFRGEHRHVLWRKHWGTEEKNKNWLSSSTARPTTDTFTTYSIRHRTVSSGENTAMSSDANTEELKRKTRTEFMRQVTKPKTRTKIVRQVTISSGENTAMTSDANTEELKRKQEQIHEGRKEWGFTSLSTA